MSFPVTGDLNGQTKVLKVPVVTLQLIFIDKNKKPVPNYEFKTVYRGRTSEIRKANARGIAIVKALAGQQLKVIHVAANKFTSNIVTDGSTEWTYSTDKLTENNSSSAGSTSSSNEPSTTTPSSQKTSPTKPSTSSDVSKGNVIRNDKITQKGPTHEVKTDQAKITIKFVDEATNKPLSGLTYWTQSTKYGKNPSTTGSDGTRGRTHDSDVGISIAVIVNENGKEVKKGTIVANSDKNGIPYVYKAKKPKVPNVQVLFNNVDRQSIVSQKSKLIIAELAEQCGMSKIYITSTLRTPEEQARAMWGKRSLYGPVGKAVHDVGSNYSQHGEARRTKEMAKAIRSYLDQGKRTSNHCVTFEIYEKLNVVDLGNNSNGFVYYENKKKYLTALGKKFKVACDQAKAAGKIKKYISGDGAEGAFHLEITQ